MGSELQTEWLTLWHIFGSVVQVSSAHRLLNKWIWNDLPRVSATWAQSHTPMHGSSHIHLLLHTHTAQTSSLSHCSYGDADAKAQTKTKRGNERNLAQRHPFVSLLTEYLRRVDMLRCSLNSYLVIYTHLLSDVMETVAEVTLTIANPPTTCSTGTISKISRWNARLHSNRKRRSYRRSSV